MRTIYRKNSTVINFYQDNGNGVLGDVVVLGEASKIARGLNMRLIHNHN
jgi:hypothetical protein